MKMKKSFILYHDYWSLFKLLTDEELGKLLRAIFNYEREKVFPSDLNDKASFAFFTIKETLDRDRAKHEAVCNRNSQIAKQRWQKLKEQENL